MPLTLEIITGERRLLRQEDVDEVVFNVGTIEQAVEKGARIAEEAA